ncbi:hypothetical protein [Phaeocystidibacter marisrubri]|uniref:Uncharacterized protein n=1 Tax=Phaeocystidibacter marisrubri TaxID=1577780 RepID=A0A6L3ZCZ3_9FLAO|nr:hypothetical protein [Phaeocystidibacter marisrubri]KAB2815506.1 hypothetical protein F8C82_07310 [Phaeocystidibacter marisrubri]GGH64248.1 hypothetical protein GCM10011318_00080 [Phaeocystidibacter marisrubri]
MKKPTKAPKGIQEAVVAWKKVAQSDLVNHNEYYYAIAHGANLLYIGIAYHQDLDTELKKTVKRLGLKNRIGLSFYCGELASLNPTKRVSERLVRNIEHILIGISQPRLNIQSKKSGTVTIDIEVKSSGILPGMKRFGYAMEDVIFGRSTRLPRE